MPRGERPLDDGDGPLLRFAADLRKLREKAGSPVYRELSRRAHYSTAVLSEAAGGRKLPSLAVTLAYVTACEGDPAQWERRWREVAAELTPVETLPPAASPYLGPAAFGIGDADRFFGRNALLGELVEAVGEHRIVFLHGESGTGKTSLLKAGLAARDRRRTVVFTPGPHPVEECAVRLAVVAGWSAPRLRDELAADPANLHLRVRQAAADGELLLIVDQFEEIFTACADRTERDTFVAALVHAATADTSRCRVVLGVRADFLDRCAELVDAYRLPMRAMTADELREAVTKPALAAGLTLETALVARLIADADDRVGTLPLVSQALKETWHRRQGMTLTLAGYDEAGGIRHAIARTAESVYLGFEPEERDIARQIFLRLTAFGDGTEDTKRRVARCEFDESPETEAVLAELVRARLVIVGLTAGRHGIELTHEALLVTWPRMREWLSEDRDGLRTHRQLTEAAAAWVALDRDPGALYRGLRLLIAEDWITRAKPVLSQRERTYFTASRHAEHDRRRLDRKRTRRLRQLVVLLIVLLLVTIFVSVEAYVSGQRQFREQGVQNIVAQLPALMHTDPYLAGQLALAAFRLEPESPQTAGRLVDYAKEKYTERHPNSVVAVDVGADLMASSAPDGSFALTELRSGITHDVPSTGAAVDSLAISADAKLLAVSYDDGTMAVWDISTWDKPVRTWTRPGDRVLVSFSRTGRILAAGGHPVDNIAGDRLRAPVDTGTSLWDATDPYGLKSVGSLPHALGPVQFSSDGKALTTVPDRGDVRTPQVWRRTNGSWAQLPATDGGPGDYSYVGESVDGSGTLVAAVTSDLRAPVALLWQSRDAGPFTKIDTLSSAPMAIAPAFDPRTGRVAVIEADGTVNVWQVGGGKSLELDGAPAEPRAMFFEPDGRLVVVGSKEVAAWTTSTDTVAAAVCNQPRSGLIPQSRWDSYFPGMEVPMPCGR